MANGSPQRAQLGLLALPADVLVELDAELGRPLEDVEELAERQPQQREDHRDRVQDRQELVGVPLHPGVADRQHQPGDADREQQEQRQEVLLEVLQARRPPWSRSRRCSASSTPAITRNDDQTRPWKMRWPTSESWRKSNSREAEDEDPVAGQVAGHGLEVDPAEHEREGDRRGEDAAPHDEQVGQPARLAPPPDELVQGEQPDEPAGEVLERSPRGGRACRNACQPRRQYSRVGGRCSHIE